MPPIMSNIMNFHLAPLLKVKAKVYKVGQDGSLESSKRTFHINSEIVTVDSLRLLLAQIFDISGEFTVSYRNHSKQYVLLEEEKDLKAAVNIAYFNPYLYLMVRSLPIEDLLDEWDIISPSELPIMQFTRTSQKRGSLVGSIISQVGRTLSRAFSFDSSPEENCPKLPMTLEEFESFLDRDGRLVNPHEFRLSVFRGGVEPNLRPIVWLHLLNVFPHRMTSSDRDIYLKSKAVEYYRLRYGWQRRMNEGEASDMLKSITNIVRKDVCRTDRKQKFYSGSDDNRNVQILFNILTTYAMSHPNVHYCQGMSDLLSPILYVMRDEARSYIAFCGLLERLDRNFKTDGRSIRTKFKHLRKMLYYHDRELFLYFKREGVSSLLFCYRWIVLELKREFEYQEALYVLEVMWGSLPPNAPENELHLGVEQETGDQQYTINSGKMRDTNDNLIWNNDHYSVSSSMKTEECSKSSRFVRTESIEIKLPIHYRKRRYRSYTKRKLNRLSKQNQTTQQTNQPLRGDVSICQSWACGDEFENHSYKINTAVVTAREFLRTQWCYSNTVNEIQLNNWLNGKWWESTGTPEKFNDFHAVVATLRQRHGSSDSNYSSNTTNSDSVISDSGSREVSNKSTRQRRRSEGYSSEVAFSYSDSRCDDEEEEEEQSDDDEDEFASSCRLMDSMVGKKYEEALTYFHRKKGLLPPPHVLGDGNPFLLFLCLTMLLQQKDKILRREMDVNELCLHFDKMVRRHKLGKVMNTARYLFGEYLNMGWDDAVSDSDEEGI